MTTTPSVQIPGWAVHVMYDLGIPDVPSYKEGAILDAGKTWFSHGSQSAKPSQDALAAAKQVVADNKSQAVTAFREDFTSAKSPAVGLANASTGAKGIGAGTMALSGIGLALKIAVIGVAAWMAVALAMAAVDAFVTGGGSLLAVAGEREIAKKAAGAAFNEATTAVMGG